MKKLYSVKEAAGLLGVSTNTIYTYLKEGKIAARRIGKGRFKIPYASLYPFVGLNKYELDEGSTQGFQEGEYKSHLLQPQAVSDSGRGAGENENDPTISIGINDIAFYRIFKALALLGTGVIYLVMDSFKVSSASLFGGGTDDVLLKILPFALVTAGFIALAGVVYQHQLKKFQGLIHAFTALVLGYYSLCAVFAQNFGALVFAAPLLAVTVLHLISGVSKPGEYTFFSQFTRYSVFFIVLSGVVFILRTDNLPFTTVFGPVSEYAGLLALIWYGTLIPILIVLLSRGGKPIFLLLFFYTLLGVIGLTFTVQTSLRGVWDASYLSFITAVFAVFLAFWHIVRVNLEVKNLHIIIAAFAWIAATCLFGIFALRVNQDQEKARLVSVINSDLERASARIVSSFENQAALLVGFTADPTLREAIIDKNSSLLANRAKDLYEKTNLSRAVVFYDSEGRSVAVYPHQSIVLGTDFSDREYFQKTKASYKGFISNVFTNILGESTMVQTEPIFYNNQFSGMIGVSMSLNALSDRFAEEFSEGASLHAVDENGAIVLASDREKVGIMSDRGGVGWVDNRQ
jgi:excisionase family DNA binding protein